MSSHLRVVREGDAIAALRSAINDLATEATAQLIPDRPVRTFHADCDTLERQVWHESDTLTVLTCDGEVFISAHERYGNPPGRLQFWPDWTALSPEEARALAAGLLGAARHSAHAHPEEAPDGR